MRWSPDAALTGLAPGTVSNPGTTMTAAATGLPLSSAGAMVTYAGRYADPRVETNTVGVGLTWLALARRRSGGPA